MQRRAEVSKNSHLNHYRGVTDSPSGALSESPGPTKIYVDHVNDVSIVGVQGELSRYNMNDLENLLVSLTKRSQYNVVLDFKRLEHLDYRLVRRLADHIIGFQCSGGDLKVVGANRYIRQILEVMGLEEEFFSTIEEALLSFLGEAPTGEMQ